MRNVALGPFLICEVKWEGVNSGERCLVDIVNWWGEVPGGNVVNK